MNLRLQTVMNLKLHTHRVNLKQALVLTFLGVLMYVSQVIMSQLPNIELVSLLTIFIARKFGLKSLVSVYIFVGCEILTYGLSMWVVNYLYIWAILALVVCLVRKIDSQILYTLISGVFGLLFGILCSVPYFFIGGFAYGIANIVSGLGFDMIHGVGNIVLTFLLYKPVTKVLEKAIK